MLLGRVLWHNQYFKSKKDTTKTKYLRKHMLSLKAVTRYLSTFLIEENFYLQILDNKFIRYDYRTFSSIIFLLKEDRMI